MVPARHQGVPIVIHMRQAEQKGAVHTDFAGRKNSDKKRVLRPKTVPFVV
jgi:hypothetical protein